MTTKQRITSSYRSQQGVVAVFATIAMAVLIGAGALALDVGNLILSKGKLQNLADSAALSAANAINMGGDHTAAITSGNQTINDNLALNGYNSLTVDSSSVSYDFSETLPFNPATSTATSTYVRVRIENVDIPDFLVSIFDIDLGVRASAVSGPSTNVIKTCNIVPLSICQGPIPKTIPDSDGDGEPDPNPDYNISGYASDKVHVLKAASSQDSDIGAGDFMPMALTDADGNTISGAKSYQEALAGSFDACMNVVEGEPITSEPGNMVGPTRGIDTRFKDYEGNLDTDIYPPDVDSYFNLNKLVKVTTVEEPDPEIEGAVVTSYQPTLTGEIPDDEISTSIRDQIYNYDLYETKTEAIYKETFETIEQGGMESCIGNASCQLSGFYRRVLAVPVLDCGKIEKNGGRMDIPLVGVGCFFIIQPSSLTSHVDSSGGQGQDSWIVGEFIDECRVKTGNPGYMPRDDGLYRIVLFKDPDSGDS
ncbi:Tad domain-containing protein [Photobacterium sagamiensis]|uniref:pilus assembly protein TadG-related protein n=1 Tax=Photobacterium sagamiensis TaxID=2910241 RepID=UPI003D0A2D7B